MTGRTHTPRVAAAIALVACLLGSIFIGAALFGPGHARRPAAASGTPAPGSRGTGPKTTSAKRVISALAGSGTHALGPHESLVATARRGSVPIYRHAGGAHPYDTLHHLPASHGAALVFLVEHRRQRWLEVRLPVRPNGATAWIRSRAVTLSETDYRIEVHLKSRRLKLFRGTKRQMQAPVGVGRSVTPTPPGKYLLVYLLRPTSRNSAFGRLAFGTSAYSRVFTSFAGGDGDVGLHGTNDPSTIGTDVSHGCIRVTNRVITRIARTCRSAPL